MNAPLDRLPSEIWLKIFSNVNDRNSLQAIILTSRAFYNLALEALVPDTIVWNTPERIQRSLQFWENNAHLSHIPKAVSMNLNNRYLMPHPSLAAFSIPTSEPVAKDVPTYLEALHRVSSFHNLGALSLSDGRIPHQIYQVLVTLPQLTHLSLSDCTILNPPPHFPLSFPSYSNATIAPVGISITDLVVRNIRLSDMRLVEFLPHLRALTTDDSVDMPIAVLQQLTSLTLTDNISIDGMNAYLQHTPQLLHLYVAAPEERLNQGFPPLIAMLPNLESFTGPTLAAVHLLNSSPTLRSLSITTLLANTETAVAIIQMCNGSTIDSVSLKLESFDDKVLLAFITHLAACRDIKLTYSFNAPTEDDIFRLGIDLLPKLSQLRRLHLHPAVVIDYSNPSESLIAWTQYNANLVNVRLSRGREWTRWPNGRTLKGRERFKWVVADVE
ncbi:hypothetical protein C8R43DRAFT_482573 [Mycena crocata]|nr:hypothetical protein C8R43DRAFT_482573 [Mycena crocata]